MGSCSHTDSHITAHIWSRLLCSISPENLDFFIHMYKILIFSCQIQLPLHFSIFHIVQATFLSFLTTQEKHGGWYYFNKENCIHLKDSLVVIFLNLKLLPSVLPGCPVTFCNKHKYEQYIWLPMDGDSAYSKSFLSSAETKWLVWSAGPPTHRGNFSK